MAGTAAADVAAVPASPPAAALPAPSPPLPPLFVDYKGCLCDLTQRARQKLPVYRTEQEGNQYRRRPEFGSTVEVWDEKLSSARSHGRIKEAEQDAARVAYEILVTKTKTTDAAAAADYDVTHALELIDQAVMLCKSILHDFAAKTKAPQPTYPVDRLGPMGLFVSSVLFGGNTYTGEAGFPKKDAEHKAARVAVKSILATKNTCMLQIIKSKESLITARMGSSNAPTSTICPLVPIKFVPAVGPTAEQGANTITEAAEQGANTITEAGSSAEVVPCSRKRKMNTTTGPDATDGGVDEHNLIHRSMRFT